MAGDVSSFAMFGKMKIGSVNIKKCTYLPALCHKLCNFVWNSGVCEREMYKLQYESFLREVLESLFELFMITHHHMLYPPHLEYCDGVGGYATGSMRTSSSDWIPSQDCAAGFSYSNEVRCRSHKRMALWCLARLLRLPEILKQSKAFCCKSV